MQGYVSTEYQFSDSFGNTHRNLSMGATLQIPMLEGDPPPPRGYRLHLAQGLWKNTPLNERIPLKYQFSE